MYAESGLLLDFVDDARVGVSQGIHADAGNEVEIGATGFVVDQTALPAIDAQRACSIGGKKSGLGRHVPNYARDSKTTQILLLATIDILTVWMYTTSS